MPFFDQLIEKKILEAPSRGILHPDATVWSFDDLIWQGIERAELQEVGVLPLRHARR